MAAGHRALNKGSLCLLQHLRLCQQIHLTISLTALVAQSNFLLPIGHIPEHSRTCRDTVRTDVQMTRNFPVGLHGIELACATCDCRIEGVITMHNRGDVACSH